MQPESAIPTARGPDALADALRGRRAVVVAGAGCSTDSGIPDYRGPAGTLRRRPPIQYQEFVRNPERRTRYWARSAWGWPRFSAARPNAAHEALARLEERGIACGVITQNVDGLHQAAGSRSVVELHGALARVRCMECDVVTSRDVLQQRLLAANAAWFRRVNAALGREGAAPAPDGDAELPDEMLPDFVVPGCTTCDGVLKPDVVFFGENVPRQRVDEAWALFDQADTLLVVGSSLTVFSGRRFVYRARERGMPIVVVNDGPTRADEFASLKVQSRLGLILPRLAEALAAAPG